MKQEDRDRELGRRGGSDELKNESKGRTKRNGADVAGTWTEYDGHRLRRGIWYGRSPDSGRRAKF